MSGDDSLLKRMFHGAVSLFGSFGTSVIVNYLVVFVFRPPKIYNILPLLPVVFLRARGLREQCSKPWRYVHLAVMLAVSFLFYVLKYPGIWVFEVSLAEILMTLVLALWCILCLEEKISLRKKDMIYPIFFVAVCVLYVALVWMHYNRRAADAIDCIVESNQPELTMVNDIESLCWHIDRVLLGGDNNYILRRVEERYGRRIGSYEAEYKELQEAVKNSDGDNIQVLMNAIAVPRE